LDVERLARNVQNKNSLILIQRIFYGREQTAVEPENQIFLEVIGY
jgi:hypothetical protein